MHVSKSSRILAFACAAFLSGCSSGTETQPRVVGLDVTNADAVGDDATSNTPPGPLTFHLEPGSPTTADELIVVVDDAPTDPDFGPGELEVKVLWLRDGETTPHTGLTLPPTATSRGQVWSAQVRAWDGQDSGPEVEASVEILNALPTMDSVTLSPGAPDVDSVLVCQAGPRSDADGDDISVNWAWAANDVLLVDEVSSSLLPPLDPEVSYRCGGAPFDGQESGELVWSEAIFPEPVQPQTVAGGVLVAQPKALDLGVVVPGETSSASLSILNLGTMPFDISASELSGAAGFAVDAAWPVTLEPGGSIDLTVTFATDTPGLHKATLTLVNSAVNSDAGVIQMLGVGASPCLKATPSSVDFGGAYVASNHSLPLSIVSCGALPVVVDDISLENPSGAAFELDLSAGPSPLPWSLAPGQVVEVAVRFEPLSSSPTDPDGNPIPEQAVVKVVGAGDGQEVQVPVSGFASEAGCPMPIIDIAEGHAVAPGTTLHLDGSGSLAPGGMPSLFSWAVIRPDGAPEVDFLPSSDEAMVTYDVDTLGTYQFSLKVFDEVDDEVITGCSTAIWDVTVKEAMPLIVELTWDTPGDSDQDDQGPGVGADLDLHLHRGGGTNPDYDGDGVSDTWFDTQLDLYWVDESPDWGEPGPDGDPLLAIQDPDGKGPETIHHPQPEPGAVYTLGVHGWSDYGFGPSVATIRIYHFEELVTEVSGAVLSSGDLWEVGVLEWPKCEFTASVGLEGGYKLTPGYPNPFQ